MALCKGATVSGARFAAAWVGTQLMHKKEKKKNGNVAEYDKQTWIDTQMRWADTLKSKIYQLLGGYLDLVESGWQAKKGLVGASYW